MLKNWPLIFQCPGICPTPSQVDILLSDGSLAFCPAMYNRVFTWVETRAKSELRVRLVPLNMLKLSSVSFYWRRFCRTSSVFLNVKKLALTPYCGVCVCVCVGGGGGGGGGVKTPFLIVASCASTMTPLSATVSHVSTGVGGCGSDYKCISLSQRVLVYACAK